MNIIMYVFSGSGNTLKIANLFESVFLSNKIDCKIVKIALPLTNIKVEPCDYLGICYPIHGFNAPKIILDFARFLPDKKNQKVFILKTSGEPLLLNNASSLKLDSILKNKGYILTNEYSYCMPYNMIFRHDEGFATKMYNTAKKLSLIDASEIINNVPHKLKKCPLGRPLSFVVRIEHPAMRVNGKTFKVDRDKCLSCMKCVKNCPTKNISVQDGKFKFGGNCVMCTECSFNCPTNAISIGILNGWKVNGKYSFNQEESMQLSSHKNYCKKSYQKYFDEANKKISLYNSSNNMLK